MVHQLHNLAQQFHYDVALPSGDRLRYVALGNPSQPAVILLHGYTDSWFSWSRVLPRLATSFRVHALDQRGHGESDRPIDGYTVPDFAADVLALMDAVGLPTATLVGHSLGSWVAQRVASLAPQRIERLALVGTSATADLEIVRELAPAVQELGDTVPVEFIREFQFGTIHGAVPPAFFEQVVSESRKVPARVWRAIAAGWRSNERWGDPARLTMPVMIACGEHDLFPVAVQRELAAELPNAALKVYPGVGHNPHWEQPDQFARDLEDFIAGKLVEAAA